MAAANPEIAAANAAQGELNAAKGALQAETKKLLEPLGTGANSEALEGAADSLAKALMEQVESEPIKAEIRIGTNREIFQGQGYVFKPTPQAYGDFRHYKEEGKTILRQESVSTPFRLDLERKAIESKMKAMEATLAEQEKKIGTIKTEISDLKAQADIPEIDNGKHAELTQKWRVKNKELGQITDQKEKTAGELKSCNQDLQQLNVERKKQHQDADSAKIKTVTTEVKAILTRKIKDKTMTIEQAEIFLKRFNLYFQTQGGGNPAADMSDAIRKAATATSGPAKGPAAAASVADKAAVLQAAMMKDIETEQRWELRELITGDFAYFNGEGRPLFKDELEANTKGTLEPKILTIDKKDVEGALHSLRQKQSAVIADQLGDAMKNAGLTRIKSSSPTGQAVGKPADAAKGSDAAAPLAGLRKVAVPDETLNVKKQEQQARVADLRKQIADQITLLKPLESDAMKEGNVRIAKASLGSISTSLSRLEGQIGEVRDDGSISRLQEQISQYEREIAAIKEQFKDS